MYFTSGSDRAFEQLMQTRPGADHFDSGEAGAPEDCGTCRFYRPHWKYQFCVYEECPYQPGKLTALDGAVKFQVKGVDDEMAVFRVEKNRGYTVMSNHHLRNKDLSLKAKGLLSQMLSLPEDWDFTLKGLSLINREQIDAIRAAVRELEQAGYIVRSRERDSQGRLRGADYIIYEQPQPVPDLPTLENPTLDNPTQEKPTQEKPTQGPSRTAELTAAQRLLYSALIGYIWYEAPDDEMNFTTLLEMINASEAREDDPEFQSPVDQMFERLEEKDPEHQDRHL